MKNLSLKRKSLPASTIIIATHRSFCWSGIIGFDPSLPHCQLTFRLFTGFSEENNNLSSCLFDFSLSHSHTHPFPFNCESFMRKSVSLHISCDFSYPIITYINAQKTKCDNWHHQTLCFVNIHTSLSTSHFELFQ